MAEPSIAEQPTKALARLAVELGANVAPGQDVVVLAYDVEHARLTRVIAEAAYEVGAHYVSVLYWDQHVKRSRLEHADEGLRLRFEGGRVVEVEADQGAAAVRARLQTDDGAVRLGEVALVDGTSPIGRSGHVFNDILFDENATCHVALGNGYSFTVPDLPAGREARAERGFNTSGIHQDLMIGGPEIAVDGLDAAGKATPILREDIWVLE